MATIRDKIHFNFDGKSSRDFNLINVQIDGGMFEESIISSRELVEIEVDGGAPLLQKVKESPLSFDMAIAFDGEFTDEIMDKVVMWLFQDDYKPLYFEDSPERIYNCIAIGDPNIVHNGLKEGYITFTMRCNSSRISSPDYITDTYNVISSEVVEIDNKGHEDMYLEISFEKIGKGNVSFECNGRLVDIRNLDNGEKIYIDTWKEVIETDIHGTYRYSNVIGELEDIHVKRGKNSIIVSGGCRISFRYNYEYRF